MSTEAIIENKRHMDGTAKSFRPGESILSKLNSFNRACSAAVNPATCTTTVAWTAPKMVEANRQIWRLNVARQFAESRADDADDVEGITACMSLLGHFAAGPIPVPVASWSACEGASLFLSTEDFYGDLEMDGDQIEYLLRWTHGGNEVEIFDSEKVEEGRVPPRLLARLYSAFAKHNAKVL